MINTWVIAFLVSTDPDCVAKMVVVFICKLSKHVRCCCLEATQKDCWDHESLSVQKGNVRTLQYLGKYQTNQVDQDSTECR